MSLLDTASLIVTPNAYKEGTLYSVIPSDGSGDMSVVRATTATRVNSAGLVELVPYNLVTWSQDFSNANWVKNNGATITTNTTTAPNGTITADTLQVSTSIYSGLYQSLSGANGDYSVSIFAKKLTKKWLYLFDASATASAWFDIENGVLGTIPSGYTASIENVGDGWYRCIIKNNSAISPAFFQLGLSDANGSYTPTSSGTAYVWGTQLTESSTALPYQKTETRLNIPRLDYSNGTCPSLLVEPQRTNLITYSEQFDNTPPWVIQFATITANDATAPDGTMTADRLNVLTNGYAGVYQSGNSALNKYTSSIFAKKGTKDWLYFVNASGTLVVAWFNISNGTLGTIINGTATIEDFGNGWYRCNYSDASNITNSFFQIGFSDADNSFTPSSNGFAYIWGAQREVGTYPTSYIPTTSASVTRNEDQISKTGISSLIGQTEGTVFIDITINSVANTDLILVGNSTGAVYDIYMFTGGNKIIAAIVNNGSYVWSQGATFDFVVGVKYKCAIGYKSGSIVFYINGIQIGSSSSTFVPFAIANKVQLAEYLYSGKQSVSFQSVSIFTTRLTNDQLAALTTI